MTDEISLEEALTKLRAGEQVAPHTVNVSVDEVNSVDALFLHRHGIEVPEKQIIYDDRYIAYDPKFDDQEWGPPQPANAQVNLDITVPTPVMEWVESKKINLGELVSTLLLSQMHSDKIINSN